MTAHTRREALSLGLLAGVSLALPTMALPTTARAEEGPALTGVSTALSLRGPTEADNGHWVSQAEDDLLIEIRVTNGGTATLELRAMEDRGTDNRLEVKHNGQELEEVWDTSVMVRSMGRPTFVFVPAGQTLLVATRRFRPPAEVARDAISVDVTGALFATKGEIPLSASGLKFGAKVG